MLMLAAATFAVALLAPSLYAQSSVFCAPPVPTPKDKPPPDNPPSCGDKKCEKCNASPCFAKTGVYTTSETDLEVPTIGFPLTVTRSYESWHAVDGPAGLGWMSNLGTRIYYATYLVSAPNVYKNEAVVVMPDGDAVRFQENTDGTFSPPLGRRETLTRASDGTFTLKLQRNAGQVAFAADGALVTMKDEWGNTLRFTLDAQRRVSRIDDDSGTGRHLTVTWNPAGRIGSVQDNANRVVSYTYAANGTLETVKNPLDQIRTYQYEQRRFAPLLSAVKDHWGRTLTEVTWDGQDRVQTYSEAGETYTMSYLKGAAPPYTPYTLKTHSLGAQSIAYDAAGLVTSRGSGTTSYTPEGDVELVTDSRGYRTRYTFFGDGRVRTATYNEGTIAGVGDVSFHYAYDPTYSDKISTIEPHVANWGGTVFNGHWRGWRYTYYTTTDPTTGQLAGALKQVDRMAYQNDTTTVLTDNCGSTCMYASYKYDTKGRVLAAWTRAGSQTTYQHDDVQMRLTVTTAGNGAGSPSTTYQFDSLGRTLATTDPLGNVTSYEYDVLGRVKTLTLPKPAATSTLNFVATYLYDQAGTDPNLNYTHVTDPNQRVTKQGYDQFDRLVESVDAAGNVTRYTYASGLLSSIEDANGNVTSYTYDSMRFLQKTTFPDGASESYTYYGDGVLKTRTDRKGVTTTYGYDAFGRLTSQTTSSQTRTFSYTGEKLMSTSDSYSGTTELNYFSYDPKTFLLTSEKQGSVLPPGASLSTDRGTINYTWDPDYDRIATYSVTDGGSNRTPPVTTYSYHADGSVASMKWGHVTGLFQFTYDLNGQVKEISFPNGQKRKYTYDGQGRTTEVDNRYGTSTILARFGYEYDRDETTQQFTMLGQRTKVTANVPAWPVPNVTTSYSYDASYQLVKTKATAGSTVTEKSWTYDAIGNRLTQTVSAGTTNYTYAQNTAGKNTSRLATAAASAVTHDLNGNMTAFGGSSYGWDSLDRMTQSIGVFNYKYDFMDRRVAVDYHSTKYIYNGLDPVTITYTNNGYYLADYLFAPGIDQPLARADYYGVTYYSVDALGSVIALSNPAGVIQNSYAYGSWGELERESGPIVQPFAYTGREFDVFTSNQRNMYHYRARRMMPGVGRFLSEDPIRWYGSGIHFYRYANNSPVLLTDPLGLWATPSEVQFCLMNPSACLDVGKCRTLAIQKTVQKFGVDVDDTPGNAFKHCYWSCCMARHMGAAKAKAAGDAHESYPGNPPCKKEMDLYNNNIGLNGATLGAGTSCEDYCSSASLQPKPNPTCDTCTP
ncbi:MAG TPA: RHS repeat-associated core domain-containing protein [Thermoanaerobaculia bacterium]|jgi:RHS repeat-associated protein